MCGRFLTTSTPDELSAEFGLFEVPAEYQPRYNIAPTQAAPALVLRDGNPVMGFIRWGLVPHWAKDPSIGSRMINARAETVQTKPAFRAAFRRRRCLIVANGFYEWHNDADGVKTPMAILPRDRRPITFAGLWERWHPAGGEPITTCTIITTAANDSLRWLHERMPVILPPEERLTWLDPASDLDQLQHLLRTREAAPLESYAVSTLVNSPRNDRPECLTPAEPGPAGE
jgi:putative SOS response-associated peptidase YedK